MPTLRADSLSIPEAPPNSVDNATPEVMPYAITGETQEPSLAREETGWEAGVLPPAAQENWMRQNLWAWLGRVSCTGFFTQRATAVIQLAGTPAVGNTVSLTYNGTTDTYVVTTADAAGGPGLVAVNWALQLTQNPVLRAPLDFEGIGGFGVLVVYYRTAGEQFPHALTTAKTGAITISAPVDRFGGTGDPLTVTSTPGNGTGLELLHGGDQSGAAIKLHYYGDAKGGAIRAGAFSGTKANAVNVGASSAAFGDDTEASGVAAFAAGNASVASGDASVAMGSNNTAAGENSVALGKSNAVTSDESMALGVSNVLNGVRVVAIGSTNFPTGDHAVAIGTTNSAAADYSTAIGKNAAPDTYGEAAIASGCFSANGDSQMGFTVFRRDNVDNVGMIVTTDGTGTGISIYLKSSNVYAISMDVTAKWLSGSGGGAGAGDCAMWRLNFMASVDGSGVVTITGMAATNVAPSQSVGQGSTYRLGYLSTANAFVLRAYSGHNSNTIRVVGSSRHTNV